MNTNHQIDELFRQKLSRVEMTPPAHLYEKVAIQVAMNRRIRRNTMIRRIVGAAAAVVLLVSAGWLLTNDTLVTLNTPPVQTPSTQTISEPVYPVASAPAESTTGKVLVAESRPTAKNTKNRTAVHQPVSNPEPVALPQPVDQNVPAAGNTTVTVQAVENLATATTKQEATEEKKETVRAEAQLPQAPLVSEPIAKKSSGHWQISAEVSPIVSTQNPNSSSLSTNNTRSLNTFGAGMLASYRLSKRLSIRSGMIYSKLKQSTDMRSNFGESSTFSHIEPIEKSGTITNDVKMNRETPIKTALAIINNQVVSLFGTEITQNLEYLEIPVSASYKLIDRRLSLGLTGGVSTNILVGNNASIYAQNMKLGRGETFNLHNVVYSGSAGFELGYSLSDRLQLRVEPRVKQYLHSISANELVNFQPVQMGIYTGITYCFK